MPIGLKMLLVRKALPIMYKALESIPSRAKNFLKEKKEKKK
jgi:hypothetical protein